MKMTPREERILEAMMKRPSKVWTIDDLAKPAYGKAQRPEHWEASLKAAMRWIATKIEHHPDYNFTVKRISGLGRGQEAEYQLIKKINTKRPFSLTANRALM